MNFFNPSVTFKGAVSSETAPTADNHLVRKQDAASLSFISSIAAGSSSMLSVNEAGALSIDSLAITDVHVDNSQSSLANFVANEGAIAASLKEGDVLILTAPSDGTETYIVSGANGSAAGNYTQIESPLTAAEVGSVLQAGDGISINAANAQISANIAAGAGLSSSVSSGQITFSVNATTDGISEGSSNLYFTQARARSSMGLATVAGPDSQLLAYNSGNGEYTLPRSVVRGALSAGTGIAYNSTSGAISINADSDDIAEGSSNLYFSDARARSALAAGTGISYTSGTGTIAINLASGSGIGISGNTISLNADSDDIGEGSSNLFFTQARARGSVSLASVSAPDAQLLTYDSGTGAFSMPRSVVRGSISGGAGIGYNSTSGAISLNADSDDIAEGSSNLYFSQARARSSMGLATVAGPDSQLLAYNSGNGEYTLPRSVVRGALSAGSALSYVDGQFAFNGNTSNVPESGNLYYTDARVRAAISAGSDADELINYNSGNGSFSLKESQIRYSTELTLSANTAAVITHNLGQKLVHVSAMDSAGNAISLQVQYTSTSRLSVTSQVGITITIAVSI